MQRSCNFYKHLIVAERARPCGSGPGELLTDCAATVQARSVLVISVQNGENSFCSKRRYDEEKSFNGHSFLPAKRGASSAEPLCSGRLAYGEGISERNPASKIDQHRRRSTSGRCWAAADSRPPLRVTLLE